MASSMMKQTDDSTGAADCPQGCVLALPSPLVLAGDKEEAKPVLQDGEHATGSDEEEDESYDSDDSNSSSYTEEEEESDDEVEVPLKIDTRVGVAAGGVRAWPRRFAFEGNTVGFLGVAVSVAPADGPAGGGQEQGGGKGILVLYRYTEFEVADDGVEVEVSKSSKLHYLRFAIPPSGDVAGSLQWAGASLSPLLYPALHNGKLQALWSGLMTTVVIPPRTTHLKLIADVGILQLEDYRREYMGRVSAKLEGMIEEPWPGYHVGMQLRLPEPVHVQCVAKAEANCERPAKRRKVVAEDVTGQECAVCFEILDSDLVVWPGCSLPHVFHGACLKLTLEWSEMCPLCRRRLSASDEQA